LVVGADLVHLLAATVWVGGVVALVAMLGGGRWAQRGQAFADVSRSAGWSVMAVAASGTAMAWAILPERAALTGTSYGSTLLVKTGVVAVVVAFGAYHRFAVVRPGSDRNTTRTTVRFTLGVEIALLVAVLVVTSLLVTQSPNQDAAADGAGGAVATRVEAALSSGAGVVLATIEPGSGARFDVMLQLRGTDGQPLVPLDPPTIELFERTSELGPSPVSAMPHGTGTYHLRPELPFAGQWELAVRVRTGTFESGSAVIVLTETGD
jgi:copper transport protein